MDKQQLTIKQVEQALSTLIEPLTELPMYPSKWVKNIAIEGNSILLSLEFGFPALNYKNDLHEVIQKHLTNHLQFEDLAIRVTSNISTHQVQKNTKPLSSIKNIIPVASGKGGVGKSTVTTNLALALAQEGANVGILDADIYGPSQPHMLGLKGHPDSPDGKSIVPMEAYGVKVMSIGFLLDTEDTPTIWRGPMVTQALQQLLTDTRWGQLDYLLIDMPPGTGDIQLTLAQRIPVSGALIVTTPQDIALLDARKAVRMFEKVGIKVLGLIENMSIHICSKCGHSEHIFGTGGVEKMATTYDIEKLGSLPLTMEIRANMDAGHPSVISQPGSEVHNHFTQIARKMTARLAAQPKEYRQAFAEIVVK